MSDIEIARKAQKKNIKEIAAKLNLSENDLRPYGHHIAKIDMNSINKLPEKSTSSTLKTSGLLSIQVIYSLELGSIKYL